MSIAPHSLVSPANLLRVHQSHCPCCQQRCGPKFVIYIHTTYDSSPTATLWSISTSKAVSCFRFFCALESRFNSTFLIRAWSCIGGAMLSVIFCMVKSTVWVQVAEGEVHIFAFRLKKKIFACVLPAFCGMPYDLPLGYCICTSSQQSLLPAIPGIKLISPQNIPVHSGCSHSLSLNTNGIFFRSLLGLQNFLLPLLETSKYRQRNPWLGWIKLASCWWKHI